MTTPGVEQWLREFLQRAEGVAGSVHRRDGDVLRIEAAVNLPPKVVEVTSLIPKGKGMAGLAFERDQPVQTCNLKTDTTGVRPSECSALITQPSCDSASGSPHNIPFASKKAYFPVSEQVRLTVPPVSLAHDSTWPLNRGAP